jgi:hypothetical protein
MQLYRYFVSQSSEFCRHNPLCCFSASVYFYFVIDTVRKLLDYDNGSTSESSFSYVQFYTTTQFAEQVFSDTFLEIVSFSRMFSIHTSLNTEVDRNSPYHLNFLCHGNILLDETSIFPGIRVFKQSSSVRLSEKTMLGKAA